MSTFDTFSSPSSSRVQFVSAPPSLAYNHPSITSTDVHTRNKKETQRIIDAYFQGHPEWKTSDERFAGLQKDLPRLLDDAGFLPDVYRPTGPADAQGFGGYSKTLLASIDLGEKPDGSRDTVCLQVFGFGKGQRTPWHDHPVGCFSTVRKGFVSEQIGHPAEDTIGRPIEGEVVKTSKHYRRDTDKAMGEATHSIHSLKSKANHSVTVHLYRMNGITPDQQAAVKTRYLRHQFPFAPTTSQRQVIAALGALPVVAGSIAAVVSAAPAALVGGLALGAATVTGLAAGAVSTNIEAEATVKSQLRDKYYPPTPSSSPSTSASSRFAAEFA